MSADLTIGQVGRTRARLGWARFTDSTSEVGSSPITWTPSTTIELVAYVAEVDWSPGSTETWWSTTSERVTFLMPSGTGVPRLSLITNAGTSTYDASAAWGFTDGVGRWIKASVVIATNTAQFHYSSDPVWTAIDSVSWTQLGTDITTATAPTTFPALSTAYIGRAAGSSGPMTGRWFRGRIVNNGTTVTEIDLGDATHGASTFTDKQGNSWTLATTTVETEGDLDNTFSIAPNPDISWDGDRLTFSGDLIATDTNEARALRRQLVGYVNNTDEPQVPVKWAPDPDLTGFYYVLGAEVGTIPASYIAGKGWFPFTVDLAALPDKYSPQFEVLVDGTNRSNSVSMTGNQWVGIPEAKDTHQGWIYSASADLGTVTAYTNGTVYLYDTTTMVDGVGANLTFSPDVDSHYRGAVRVETSRDGVNWRVVTGRQIPDQDTNWRLTNGRVRFTGNAGTTVRAEVWDKDSVQWEPVDFQVGWNSSGFTNAGVTWSQPSVNVNRPEVGSVKIQMRPYGAVDFTLRRGGCLLNAAGYMPNDSSNWGIFRTAAEAATVQTNGILATAANTNGNRFVLVSSGNVTQVTNNTTGIYLSSNSNRFNFGLSPVTGTAPFSATNTFWIAVENFAQPIAK